MSDNKRKYIRHPSDIPIEIKIEDVATSDQEYLSDISLGGLSFKSRIPLELGRIINIKIPLVRPVFQTRGKIVWCREDGDHYNIGVQFVDQCDTFRIRMAEQICSIEQYKNDALVKEGRTLTGTEAALEWIRKYAEHFPDEE